MGLIKEIDYRLAAKGKCAAEFNGIILIDEIETHLHPVWQGKICIVLKEIFPKAQFFCNYAQSTRRSDSKSK